MFTARSAIFYKEAILEMSAQLIRNALAASIVSMKVALNGVATSVAILVQIMTSAEVI